MSTMRSGRTFKALEMEPEMLLEPIGEPSVPELMRMMMEDRREETVGGTREEVAGRRGSGGSVRSW